MLCIVKMLLKQMVGGSALNSHGNSIIDNGESYKNHGIVFLNFEPCSLYFFLELPLNGLVVSDKNMLLVFPISL